MALLGLTNTNRLTLSRSDELVSRAQAVIPGVTQTRSKRPNQYAPGAYPVYVARGEGAYVWDVDGNKYIDYVLACGPIVLGYGYPAVDEAIRRQLERGIIFGQLSPVEVEAAEAIVAAVPNAEMVRFFKGGVEACSAAVRIARAYTGREIVASCGYRGWHDQWAVTDERTRRGVPSGLRPFTLPFAYGDLDALAAMFRMHPGQIAAVILEPATVGEADPAFLAGARTLASDDGALLIFDEVVTGFRLALGGAQEHFGVDADLAVFAKAVANGMPLSAVTGPREIMRLAEDLFITLTYGDEALSLAAAVAVLREMRAKDVHGYLWSMGRRLMDGLAAAAEQAALPVTLKGLPPMSRLEIDAQTVASWNATGPQVWAFLLAEMARRGVLWRGGIFFLNYSHGEEEIDYTIAKAEEAFAALRRAGESGALASVSGVEQGLRVR
jgi:glutamate-1-semialdehyde aminotransferase